MLHLVVRERLAHRATHRAGQRRILADLGFSDEEMQQMAEAKAVRLAR